MGKVYASVEIENAFDAHDARRSRLSASSVRRVTLGQMMADTGASHPFLPRGLIDRLGLEPTRSVPVETASGPATVEIFEGAQL